MMSIKSSIGLLVLFVFATSAVVAQQVNVPEPKAGTIIGTVIDVNEGTVPGASVVLEGRSLSDSQRVATNDRGFFELDHVNPGIPTMSPSVPSGFANWTSPEVVLKPGQFLELKGIQLRIAVAVTTVNAVLSTEEIARQSYRRPSL